MEDRPLLAERRRPLRWKLTLSYTAVTVAALLTVELVLLGGLIVLLVVSLNTGFLPAQLIEAASASYAPELRFYLAQTPPDQAGIAGWLERVGRASSPTIPLTFDATDEMLVVGSEGRVLGARPADLLGSGEIGQLLDGEATPRLSDPIQAALAGEEDVEQLFTLDGPGGKVVLAIPIWDAAHEQVLGALAAMAPAPTLGSLLGDTLPIIGVSLLLFLVIAGAAGAAFGYLAAREPVQRLDRLANATLAWSRGDFTVHVDDAGRDELGELAHRLNDMARQLQQLLETRRELAQVEERNRLARDLHDSVKQQAFAAAAQVSGVRTLLKRDPEAAEAHIEEAERLIYELRRELTGLIFELRPAALEGKGLASAVGNYAADWSQQYGIALEVRIQGERSLPLDIEQPLFRVVQEALANVARHSQASRVEIAMNVSHGEITLTVTDDGCGFDAEDQHDGFGLSSMRQRAQSLGGELTVQSVRGKGASISCWVPITESGRNRQEESHG